MCVWEPVQRIEHVGLELDTVAGTFRVSERKLEKLREAKKKSKPAPKYLVGQVIEHLLDRPALDLALFSSKNTLS